MCAGHPDRPAPARPRPVSGSVTEITRLR